MKPSASTLRATTTRSSRGVEFAGNVEKLKMKESRNQIIAKTMRYMIWSRCACGSSASPSFLVLDSN